MACADCGEVFHAFCLVSADTVMASMDVTDVSMAAEQRSTIPASTALAMPDLYRVSHVWERRKHAGEHGGTCGMYHNDLLLTTH